jgi:DNA-binding transcriptional LysR family regulator
VEVRLHELNSAVQQAALERGQIDAGLVQHIGRSPHLAHEVLRSEPFVAALPSGHPLAEAPTVTLADLAGERFVIHPRGGSAGFYEQIVAACQAQGLTPTVVQEATEMLTLVGLVAAGMGIALVPAPVSQLRTAGVVYRQLCDAALTTDLVLAWRAEDPSPLVAAFRAVTRETVDAEAQWPGSVQGDEAQEEVPPQQCGAT